MVNILHFILGLPENPNVVDFERLWNNRSAENNYHPITLLSSLLHSSEDALKLHERLKFSAYERDLSYFISTKKSETKQEELLM